MAQIIFSTDDSWTSRLVRLGTFSWCSHVSIIHNDLVIEALPSKGVTCTRLDVRKRQSTRFEIYECDIDAAALFNTAAQQIDKPYDWTGVFGLPLHRNWQDGDAWFCSELVAWAAQQLNKPLVREDAYRVTPRDLLISSELRPYA